MKSTISAIIVSSLLIFGAFLLANKDTNQVPSIKNVEIIDGIQVVTITAKGGYQPTRSIAKAGIPTIVRFNTSGTFDCSIAVRIPSLNLGKNLPFSGNTDFDIGTSTLGTLDGTCSMGMYSFAIDFQK